MREGLERLGAGAFLVTDIRNIRYLSGFTGSSAAVLVTEKRALFFTDSRYTTQAEQEVKGPFTIREAGDPIEAVSEHLRRERIRSLVFEEKAVNYSTYLRLRRLLRGFGLKPSKGLCERIRAVKEPFEVQRIKRAVKVLNRGFGAAIEEIRPGTKERDAALGLEFIMKRAGAEDVSFDIIVASGPRSALPHGKASNRRIRRGEFVMVDMGVLLDGYNSDKTRTYLTGRPTRRQKKVYDTVKGAHDLAIEKVRPGVEAREIDAAARDHIERAGFGRFFGHGTGHGVGVDVHEAPVIGPKSREVLKEGMVFTIEPGIYIPGWGGVRIEDMVVVTSDGCRVLTEDRAESGFLHLED